MNNLILSPPKLNQQRLKLHILEAEPYHRFEEAGPKPGWVKFILKALLATVIFGSLGAVVGLIIQKF